MERLDCLVDINDTWTDVKNKFTIFFTINMDPLKISNDPIKFNGYNEYGGYSVIASVNEHSRRLVHWFYRNIDVPTFNDWNRFIRLFNLQEIPLHILQLYDNNKDPMCKFILIHSITRDFIHYTYENRENNTSTTVTVPMGIASLVPERFLFNLKLYCEPINQ